MDLGRPNVVSVAKVIVRSARDVSAGARFSNDSAAVGRIAKVQCAFIASRPSGPDNGLLCLAPLQGLLLAWGADSSRPKAGYYHRSLTERNMAAMKSLLVASAQKRLAISAILALFGLFIALAFSVLQARSDWQNQRIRYEAKQDGSDTRCVKILTEARKSQKAPDWCRNRVGEKSTNEYACLLEEERAIRETAQQYGCTDSEYFPKSSPSEIDFESLFGALPASNPGPLSDFVIARVIGSIWTAAAFAGIGFIFLFILSDTIKRLLLDPHPGWRRLIIVLSGVGGLAGFGYVLSDAYDPFPATFLVAILSLVGTLALAVYGRALWRWVSDGFSTPRVAPSDISALSETAFVSKEARSSRAVLAEGHGTASVQVAPSESGHSISFCPACQAETEHEGSFCSVCGRNTAAAALAAKSKSETTKELNLTWLWWLLGLTFVALSFIFNSGRALETLISTTVQAAILVPLIWLATRKKK